MGPVEIDTTEVRQWSRDATVAVERVSREIRASVFRGAMQIKAQLRAEMGASESFRGVVNSIDFDITGNAAYSEAQIGPKSGPGGVPGDLAHIAYWGGSRGGGGTVPDPQGALDAEAPKFEKAVTDILEGLL